MTASVPPDVEKITERIIGAAFDVSTTLGSGFLEAVYRRALAHELRLRGAICREEVPFKIVYKVAPMGTYVADMIVDDAVVVELKAIEALNGSHVGQTLNYLKASGLTVGLLMNFGKPKLEFRRVLA